MTVAVAEAVDIFLYLPLLEKGQNVSNVFVLPRKSLDHVVEGSRPVLSPSKKIASLSSGVFTSQLKDGWEGSVFNLKEGLSGRNTTLDLVGFQHQINCMPISHLY